MFFGTDSTAHACSTERMAYKNEPTSATNTTNHTLLPASTMPAMVTPVSSMLDITTLRRPHLSDR